MIALSSSVSERSGRVRMGSWVYGEIVVWILELMIGLIDRMLCLRRWEKDVMIDSRAMDGPR